MARGGFRGNRMFKSWRGSSNTSLTLTGAGTSIASSIVFVDTPNTILRTLGGIRVAFSDQTLVAGDQAQITLGLFIVNQDAFSVGASAMPDPAGEPEADWLWWYPIQLFNFGVTTEALFAQGAAQANIRIETKAMRKTKPNDVYVLLAEYEDISGSPAVHVSGSFRTLIGT